MKKHSNIYYILKKSGFEAVEAATGYKNSHGLDLFRYDGYVYEGRCGMRLYHMDDMARLDAKIEEWGGIGRFNEIIDSEIAKTGESPRYTRPEERKQEVFPPDPEKEKTVLAENPYTGKHYFYRFYSENGVELYTLKNDNRAYRTVFAPCDGYMLGIGQYQNLKTNLEWLAGLENGIKGEMERRFNESMENPSKIADMGFAIVLGRVSEAEAHNAPILEAREKEYLRMDNERDAKRAAEKQAAREEYANALNTAVEAIRSDKKVNNTSVQGKSLIMQLFREYGISVPLKTQGWIINSLADIHSLENGCWSYHYTGNNSTVFRNYIPQLISAIKSQHIQLSTD